MRDKLCFCYSYHCSLWQFRRSVRQGGADLGILYIHIGRVLRPSTQTYLLCLRDNIRWLALRFIYIYHIFWN